MVVWKEIEGIHLNLNYLTDEAIIKMVRTMPQEERLKIIEALKKETTENKNLSRALELGLRLAGIAITTLL
jgi:hypothetical protein